MNGREPRFAVGDVVRFTDTIRTGTWCYSPRLSEAGMYFSQPKKRFLEKNGFVATIRDINKYGFYTLVGEPDNHHYADNWIVDYADAQCAEVSESDLFRCLEGNV